MGQEGSGGKNKALSRCPSCSGLEGLVNLLCTLNSLRLAHWLLFSAGFPFVTSWSPGVLELCSYKSTVHIICSHVVSLPKRIAPVRFETLPCTGQNSGLKKKYCDKELSDLKKQTVCPQCPITSCFSAHHPQPPMASPLQKGNSALLCLALFSFSHCLQTKSLLLARVALICKALKFLSILPFPRHLGRGFFKHGFGA